MAEKAGVGTQRFKYKHLPPSDAVSVGKGKAKKAVAPKRVAKKEK